MRDVPCCVTVDYQQIGNGNMANQIHGFTIDYGKFILIAFSGLYQACSGSGICQKKLFIIGSHVTIGARRERGMFEGVR